MSFPISVVIPAAGVGRRMKSYGPKPLIDMGDGRSVMDYQLKTIKGCFPNAEIIMIVGFQADRVIKQLPAGVKVVENELYEQCNVARSIAMGLRIASHNHILLVNGDILFNSAALEHIERDESVVVYDSRGKMKPEEVGLMVVDGRVTNFAYSLPEKWAQIAYLEGKELKLFKKVCQDREKSRFYTFELLNIVLSRGGKISAVEPDGLKLAELDSTKDIEIAKQEFSIREEREEALGEYSV